MKPTKYSEMFYSIQGEGHYTGIPTLWLRYFSCNLQCNGFGQVDPTNPETYDLPFEKIDLTDITEVEQLPVFEKGCDSSYTWSKKFRHLMKEATPEEAADRLLDLIPGKHFTHPKSKQTAHMCFTGGEPLTKLNRMHSLNTVTEFLDRGIVPGSITYETNGTQQLDSAFFDTCIDLLDRGLPEIFWSVSPKLWTVAGEKPEKAIKPNHVQDYGAICNKGQLKFVVGSDENQWDEMRGVIDQFRAHSIDWDVWIMPTGATEEQQIDGAGKVAEKALQEGYNVSARVHTYLFGNAIGT